MRREKRNTQEGDAVEKGWGGGQTQNIDVLCIQRLFAPKNEDVCENI